MDRTSVGNTSRRAMLAACVGTGVAVAGNLDQSASVLASASAAALPLDRRLWSDVE